MKKSCLRFPYPVVERDGSLSYGGNQSWFDSWIIRKSGCGAVAGTDVLLYLSLHKESCATEVFREAEFSNGILELEEYKDYVNYMRRHYFPIIPKFGMTGWMVVLGLNRYFRKNRIGLQAVWGLRGRNMWSRISAMLAHDIPVILMIGPNFPLVWGKHKLTFYHRSAQGEYSHSCQTKAHFVTVTGMDDTWMRISSWGQEYYINRIEYQRYVQKHSNSVISNICYIRAR